jgi:hypothetical protein
MGNLNCANNAGCYSCNERETATGLQDTLEGANNVNGYMRPSNARNNPMDPTNGGGQHLPRQSYKEVDLMNASGKQKGIVYRNNNNGVHAGNEFFSSHTNQGLANNRLNDS